MGYKHFAISDELTTKAPRDAGPSPNNEQLIRALDWIKARPLLGPEGYWRVYCLQLALVGFSFEHFNTWCPDVDETALLFSLLSNRVPIPQAHLA